MMLFSMSSRSSVDRAPAREVTGSISVGNSDFLRHVDQFTRVLSNVSKANVSFKNDKIDLHS